jgi:recombination protein RecT
MGACLKAAALNLPIEPSLGLAYPVPYSGTATFMIGWKGYVQLAMRTGQYKKIVVTEVRVGEVVNIDHFTETYEFSPITDDVKRQKSAICGYYTMFELNNGYKKELYWPIEKILAHGKKYSKCFNFGAWKDHRDEMCRKTMIKQLIPKWGIMSVEMSEAYKADQAVVEYDPETGEEITDVIDFVPEDAVEADVVIEQDSAEAEFNEVKNE